MSLSSLFKELNSIESLHSQIAELKTVNRRLLSNFYMDEAELEEKIIQGNVNYEYSAGEYLNLIIRDDGFDRLYFWVANAATYRCDIDDKIIVCDIFLTQENDALNQLIQQISKSGFQKYAIFYKWMCKAPNIYNLDKDTHINIVDGYNDKIIDLLYDNFDKYTDYLPHMNQAELFAQNKEIVLLYTDNQQEPIGGLVYSRKELTATEDFVFVNKSFRGNGLSNLLHNEWYKRLSQLKLMYIAWIRDDNQASIALHQHYGYEQQKLKKITFVKGMV